MKRPSFASSLVLLAGLHLSCHQLDLSPRVPPGEIGIFDDLFSVSVVDESRAVAVGYQGTIYWTEDGGENWRKGDAGTQTLLYSVSMADSQHGWAVGQGGVIVRTRDGGKTWQPQPNVKFDEGAHLFGVQAIDASTAWVVGEWGTRLFTTDGGSTWQDQSITISPDHPMFVWLSEDDQQKVRNGQKVYEDIGLTDVFCLPAPSQRCWIIGEFGYIFHSEDHGANWQRSEIVGEVSMEPIPFAFDGVEVGNADKARLIEFARQIENQAHLNVQIDPLVSAQELAKYGNVEDPYALFDMISARLDEVGGILEEAGILSDRFRIPNKPPWDFEDFQENDPGFLQRYFDGRKADAAQVRVSVIQNPYLFTVHFADEQRGYIAGLGGVILLSDDGGINWRYETIDRKQALFSIATAGERAFAVGEKGLVRVSTDSGITWSEPSTQEFPTVFTFMRDMGFDHKSRVGFVVGQQGMVLRTTDGGKTWQQVLGDMGLGRLL